MTISLKRNEDSAPHQDNILPMINIVFLLLIFFLMAGALAKSPDVSLTPPETVTAKNDKLPYKALYLTKNGVQISKDEIITSSELETKLSGILSSLKDKPLYIIADKESDAFQLIKVANAAKKIGIEKVKLLTLRGEKNAK